MLHCHVKVIRTWVILPSKLKAFEVTSNYQQLEEEKGNYSVSSTMTSKAVNSRNIE